jgi:hypothetical protein
MVAKSYPNKITASLLNISSWTVCTHLRRIFAKLGVASRAAMVAQLLQTDVVDENPPLSTTPGSCSERLVRNPAKADDGVMPR